MAVLVSDSFNRADSNTTLGTTDSAYGGTAKTWVNYGPSGFLPTYGISTNRAYMVSNAGGFGTQSFTAINVGASDAKMSLKLSSVSTSVALVVRASANNNYIVVGTGNPISIQTCIAGTFTTIGTATGIGTTNGDILAIELNGTTINVYKNGTLILTATSTFNQTATLFGFSGTGSTSNFVDDFQVDSLSTGGTGTPGSISYATKQSIYQTSSTALATKQVINRPGATAYATKQTIYQVGSISYATQQTITDGGIPGAISYRTKQVIYQVSSAQMATKQAIYRIEIVEVLRTVNLQGEFKTSVSLQGEMINKVALEGEI